MDLTDRTFMNPVTREKAVILETSQETGGKHTLIRVTLSQGGGNPIHFHTRFTEIFKPVDGTLGIHLEGKEIFLSPGDEVAALPLQNHRFYNPTEHSITFDARLEPGQPGFENFMQALFGLVRDGKTFGSNQIPLNPFYAALLLEWGDTRVDNVMFRLSRPFIQWLVTLSRKRGHEQRLREKYVRNL